MKLVLFCDYGLDDAAATVDALTHAGEDGYQEVVLVAVGGNVPPDVSLKNALKLVAHCKFPHPPVTVVDTTADEQPFEFLKEIHGGDGMGDLFEESAETITPVRFSDWLESFSGAYRLLSLGPMTLVPHFLKRHADQMHTFVFMGGNISETPNFHGYEFNHALNRKAFTEAVVYPHVAVTMDTCRNPLFNIQNKEIAGGGMLRSIVQRAKEMTFVSSEKGCYLWDDIAVKCLRHPDWFRTRERTDKDGNLLTVAEYIRTESYLNIIEE